MMKKTEILRNQRYEAIFNENNGFFDKARMKGSFLTYFKGGGGQEERQMAARL